MLNKKIVKNIKIKCNKDTQSLKVNLLLFSKITESKGYYFLSFILITNSKQHFKIQVISIGAPFLGVAGMPLI